MTKTIYEIKTEQLKAQAVRIQEQLDALREVFHSEGHMMSIDEGLRIGNRIGQLEIALDYPLDR